MTATDPVTLDDVTATEVIVEDVVPDVADEQTPVVSAADSSSTPNPSDPPAAVPDRTDAEGETPAVQSASPVDAVDARLVVLDGRLDALNGRLVEIAEALRVAGAAGESVQKRLNAIAETEASTADRLAQSEGRLVSAATAGAATQQQIESVVGRLASVDARLDSLGEQIGAVLHRQADHDRALDEVERTIAVEVERHTSDALVESRHSVQLAVNSIAQMALAMAESSRDLTEDVSAESATALLDSFRVDLDAILGQLGFVPLETKIGLTFDPHRHRALKRVTTSDPAQDKVITRVLRDGYLAAATGRILLFADVEVSRYRT